MDTEPRGSPFGGVVLFCREDSESCVPSAASGRYLFIGLVPFRWQRVELAFYPQLMRCRLD